MKALLLPIQSKWLVKILNGEKTIEVRKSIPKDFVGWVYLYCTKAKPYLSYVSGDWCIGTEEWSKVVNGKVVARFWLDEVDLIINGGSRFYVKGKDEAYTNTIAKASCLDFNEMRDYSKGKNLYAWHIKNLEIFDTPKELSEFGLKRAFQSWGYVEIKEGVKE